MIEHMLALGSGLSPTPSFTGDWRLEDHKLEIRVDGTAASDLPGRDHGTWNEALERLRIQWRDGAVGLVYRERGGLTYCDFGSGRSMRLRPAKAAKAEA
ncbi:MAG: hypothetical protein AAF495_04100 [Pseudomonadota bacterium]